MNNLLLSVPQAGGTAMTFMTFLPFIMILVVSYFMLIRPQKKRETQLKEMRAKIEVGDEIITTGGIIGRVVSHKDDTILIETGSDRSKVRIARWAIHMNLTVLEAEKAAKQAPAEK